MYGGSTQCQVIYMHYLIELFQQPSVSGKAIIPIL